jgi:uncharacterized protein YpmB
MKMVQVLTAIFVTLLFCSMTLAQEPVVNIDKKSHANLAEAQQLLAQANHYIAEAQKDNKYNLQGHAQKARELLVQASQELKAAAEAANAEQKTKH